MKKFLLAISTLVMLYAGGCKDDSPCTPPVVSAGEDQVLSGVTTATLASTTSIDAGTWSIVAGTGGTINNGATVTLTGVIGTKYVLKFESTNSCGSASDEVTITLNRGCGANMTVDQQVSNIHWIQQACFRIETSAFTVYTDPNSITKKDTADVIVITHAHGDHFSSEDIAKIAGPNTIIIAPQDVTFTGTYGPRITLKPGEIYSAFGCISIKAVPAYNITKTQFHPKGNNWVGYLITIGGVTIYHAGDTERIPEMKEFTCDIAMLPLGQTYTFNSVADAAEAAKDVKAKVAIPMHFGLYEGNAADAVTFKNLLNGTIPVVIKERGN